MSRWSPCKRHHFIKELRAVGFEGPFAGSRHEFLAPALPYLIGLGGKAAEEAAKESGKAGVKKVWDKLRPKVEAKEAAREAADDLAADPADPDAQAAEPPDGRGPVARSATRFRLRPDGADLASTSGPEAPPGRPVMTRSTSQ